VLDWKRTHYRHAGNRLRCRYSCPFSHIISSYKQKVSSDRRDSFQSAASHTVTLQRWSRRCKRIQRARNHSSRQHFIDLDHDKWLLEFRLWHNHDCVCNGVSCGGLMGLTLALHERIFTRDSILCYSAYMPRQFRMSVCPSVCPSHACIVSKRLNASSKFFHRLIGPSF